MKKFLLLTLLTLLTTNLYAANSYKTKFNPFTSKPDYILGTDSLEVDDLIASDTVTGIAVCLEGGTYDTYLYPGIPTSTESYTLPLTDGSDGQQLTTDGSGSLRWGSAGGVGSGAPTTADYLVGTANGDLSAEIVVGTAPGGELGGTWASPTIDDSLAVTSWNLTTPTITTSLTTSTPTTLSAAELDRLDGLTSAIIDDDKIDTFAELDTIVADTTLVNGATYREITLLPESCVLDDTVPPAITVVESTGTGTPRFRVADFDSTADEVIYFTFVMPSDATASADPIIDFYWYTNDVGPNEGVAWACQVSATTEADADTMAEQAADTDILVTTEDCNETEANRLIKTSGTLTYATYMDGAVAGDVVTIRIFRDISDAADDLTSDARLVSIHLKIPRS